jgi:hypothetical protein
MVFPTDAEDRGSLSSLHSGEYQQTDENNNVSQGVKDGDELLPFADFLPVQEGASEGKSGFLHMNSITPPHLQDGQHHMESKCLSLQLTPLQQLPSKVILPSNIMSFLHQLMTLWKMFKQSLLSMIHLEPQKLD